MADQETKERIMEQAGELFRRYGIRSVTMDDLASHLSISKKTIYQFFKDKKEVIKASMAYMMDREFADLNDIEERARDVIEELVMLSEYFRKMTKNMNPTLLFDLKKYHPQAWNIYLNQKETFYREKLEKALIKGQKQGLIRRELHPVVVSRIRMEMVEMGFNPDIFPPDDYEASEVQMALFDLFIHGIITSRGMELMNEYLEAKAT